MKKNKELRQDETLKQNNEVEEQVVDENIDSKDEVKKPKKKEKKPKKEKKSKKEKST